MSTVNVRRGIAECGRAFISEATGFDNADEFDSEAQVSDYFTVAVQTGMFGECAWTQADLDAMAEAVIENGWHCSFHTAAR